VDNLCADTYCHENTNQNGNPYENQNGDPATANKYRNSVVIDNEHTYGYSIV
jgi:predicted CxxxxCH...CXXCH cytochrome family protein